MRRSNFAQDGDRPLFPNPTTGMTGRSIEDEIRADLDALEKLLR